MEIESLLFAAIQSSFLLGLLHGVNPCGHSWLVLAPFVTGQQSGSRVTLLTVSFLSGTALACLALGASLGAISQFIPVEIGVWVEVGTSILLIVLGICLVYNPHLLHHHNDGHDHKSCAKHHHGECSATSRVHHENNLLTKLQSFAQDKKMLPIALFGIGFVNMIIPCPTAAVMYGYALNSGSTLTATLVFGVYAISTAIAVGGVIYVIFKATNVAGSLQKKWVEPLIMRLAGGVIIIFSVYGLYRSLVHLAVM